MFSVTDATDALAWDAFLCAQRYRPFLQSWAMGEVYRRVGQEPVRLVMHDGSRIVGICFGHVVNARRGRHISIPYGPLFAEDLREQDFTALLPQVGTALKNKALMHGCTFVRMSPFLHAEDGNCFRGGLANAGFKTTPSPLHLLAEHLWYLPLQTPDPWQPATSNQQPATNQRTAESIFASFRSTTRNLIRRAEKEGVTIERSSHPMEDVKHFLVLHEETRRRHHFTPYTDAFFRAQVEEFTKAGSTTLYMAHYQNEVIAASIHMHMGGETSYHHGASTHRFSKIPASYLLQWTAIQDAIVRGDRVYNFWGIAPGGDSNTPIVKNHPFAGVTLFKTGFGGKALPLTHCLDLPVSKQYQITKAIEVIRKWRRGF